MFMNPYLNLLGLNENLIENSTIFFRIEIGKNCKQIALAQISQLNCHILLFLYFRYAPTLSLVGLYRKLR